jgi:hypothetical protein
VRTLRDQRISAIPFPDVILRSAHSPAKRCSEEQELPIRVRHRARMSVPEVPIWDAVSESRLTAEHAAAARPDTRSAKRGGGSGYTNQPVIRAGDDFSHGQVGPKDDTGGATALPRAW